MIKGLVDLKKVKETYDNGVSVELLTGCLATREFVDEIEPLFFKNPHGSRESVTWHGPGFIVSATDRHCGKPVRRRGAYLVVFSESDQRWMTWYLGSVGSIAIGQRVIDRVMETGVILP